MKLCPNCDQPVGEEITICPSCGSDIGSGREYIDDYRIVDVLHEGHSSLLCRAIRERTNEMVMIRLFTSRSGVDEEAAAKLRREIEELKKLPLEGFVRHYAIRRSSDGLWYRISEWIDAENWGSLLATGRLSDRRILFDLFFQMASALSVLHHNGYFIPHLTLNDIVVITDENGNLQIKIDYKLFRFFDPKLTRPGPMLKRLMAAHPDIIHGRPLDFRSDIWSLGKIFVELLTTDLETTNFLSKIEDTDLPREFEVLLKVMLADDPDMRPRSMAEVARSLGRVKTVEIEEVEKAQLEATLPPKKTIKTLQKRLSALTAIVLLLIILGFLAWFQLGPGKKDSVPALERFANQYAPSVAFLLVEYWLEGAEGVLYRNRGEGTAFLVDKEGTMLTSRHVACPWMEDVSFYALAQHLRLSEKTPRFGFNMYLWFEGTKAFNRAGRLIESSELADLYFIETAYSKESTPRVSIVGIPKTPVLTQQVFASPLRDDFAVLKIDPKPEGLLPLPLDLNMDTQEVPKLSRFITLGFPLGSRTQEATVNVSVTSGHVRRSFENMLQVDASIYAGNSGGPVIDARGRVIGILCGVATERSQGLLPVVTPRWDMGMVLPVTKAVQFLKELEAGRMKWTGIPDFSLEEGLKKIAEAATEGRWAEAQAMADREMKRSQQPPFYMAAGIMHFCNGDFFGAKELFLQCLSMDEENSDAKFMLVLIDRPRKDKRNPTRQELLSLDWRSPAEFQGYLTRVLEGLVDQEAALKGWYTEKEKSWLHYVVALLELEDGKKEEAERLLREAVLSANVDAWEFFLSRAKLEEVQKERGKAIQSEQALAVYNADVETFYQTLEQNRTEKEKRKAEITPIVAELSEAAETTTDKLKILKKLRELYPQDRDVVLALAFYSAAEGGMPQALDYVQAFLKEGGREESGLMSGGLLKAGILHYQGHEEKARAWLESWVREIRDPWYVTIGEYLLGKSTEASLKAQAGESPENLVTAYAPLGFWAEGSKDSPRALRYYREALGSFLDDWLEYDFAKGRLKKLRSKAD
jgi:serine/threonine protein kinase